jgi:hypothetical protein
MIGLSQAKILVWMAIPAVIAVTGTWVSRADTTTTANNQVASYKVVSFRQDVFPIFRAHCLPCHQPGGLGYEKSGLDLRTYEGLMKGTKYGSIVVPGDAFMSNLNVLVERRADPRIAMPHGKRKMRMRNILFLRRWVNQGAMNN